MIKLIRFTCCICIAALALGACGEVQLDGKLFDAIGANEMLNGKKEKVHLRQRSKLILPPNTGALPTPGAAVATNQQSQYWPDDPDLRKKAEAKAHAEAMKIKCREIQWSDRKKTDFVMPKECGTLLDGIINSATN